MIKLPHRYLLLRIDLCMRERDIEEEANDRKIGGNPL